MKADAVKKVAQAVDNYVAKAAVQGQSKPKHVMKLKWLRMDVAKLEAKHKKQAHKIPELKKRMKLEKPKWKHKNAEAQKLMKQRKLN